jgi:hypothetical protein
VSHLIEVAFRGNRKEFFSWDGDTPPALRAGIIVDADRGEDFGRVHATGELAAVRCNGCAHGCGTTPPPRKALRLVALVDKLPVTIYDKLFAPAANSHGLPDQLITDKGSEWCVAAFACLLLADAAGRSAASRRAHRFVPSKRNVRAPPLSATLANGAHVVVPLRLAPLADSRRALQLRD